MALSVADWAFNPQSVVSKASEQWEEEYNKEKNEIQTMLANVKKGKTTRLKSDFQKTLERQDVLLANNHTYRQTMHVNNEMTDALTKEVEMLKKTILIQKNTIDDLFKKSEKLLTSIKKANMQNQKSTKESFDWQLAYRTLANKNDELRLLLENKNAKFTSIYRTSQNEIRTAESELKLKKLEIKNHEKRLKELCAEHGGTLDEEFECYYDGDEPPETETSSY